MHKIIMGFIKTRPVSLRISPQKLTIFATTVLVLMVFLIILVDTFAFNLSVGFNNIGERIDQLKMQMPSETMMKVQPTEGDHGPSAPPAPVDNGKKKFRAKNRLKPEDLGLFNSTELSRRFDSRVEEFLSANQCRVQFFMTWFAPVDSFGKREFFGMENLFQTNHRSCLVIVSKTEKLEPLIGHGYRIRAITPDLWDLLKSTSGETWLKDIRNGARDPGVIPLQQNLSNLIGLVVLDRYGGVYLDIDYIVLRDFSGSKNSIGAQSADVNGNWSRLNNVLLAFDKKHPFIYRFIEEFATTFNGNKWGHNGPYLVSRVVNSTVGEIQDINFTVMPTTAFYPVNWIKISKFFSRPNDTDGEKWVESTIHRLHQSTYAVHLWNKQSRKLKIEEGSVIWRLLSEHCVICR